MRRVLHTLGHFSPSVPDRAESLLSRAGSLALAFSLPYSPEYMEGCFSEVRQEGFDDNPIWGMHR